MRVDDNIDDSMIDDDDEGDDDDKHDYACDLWLMTPTSIEHNHHHNYHPLSSSMTILTLSS